MSFGDHLEELRRRVAFALLGIIPLFIGAFLLGRPMLAALIEPAREQLLAGGQAPRLLATSPTETFGVVMHLAVVATILVGAPWILYQLWLFVAPGLHRHERRFVHLLLPMSAVLAVAGVAFLYFVILPVVLQFFIGFSNQVTVEPIAVAPAPADVFFPNAPVLAFDPAAPAVGDVWINTALNQLRVCVEIADGVPRAMGVELIGPGGITQQYKVADYIKLFLGLAMGFGVGFQMPVVVLLLGWVGIVRPGDFKRYRKYIFLGCIVAAAVLTPADPFSMILLAVPLYGLFELGVLLLRVLPAERIVGRAKEPADAGDA